MKNSDERLGRWPISVEISVQWRDLDALNHVNHTVFLTWMETSRMVYFERCGMMDMMESNGMFTLVYGYFMEMKLKQ